MAKELTKMVEAFKALPDFNRFPLPEIFYTKYGMERPKHNNDDMRGALVSAVTSMNAGGIPFEERGPAEGGVREVKLPDPVISEVIPNALVENNEPILSIGPTGTSDATDTKLQQLQGNEERPDLRQATSANEIV
jgi:hypothetical protein